ncbi:YciI family protein [Marinobacter sp. ATCH36]|uniref:YciI family protein n=1 Tax=Marinobacter sp. ATCH36 TaxID=2945106 RepID=UPI002021BA63|nr:YciI family protein [Marinobacter sp. ATCH36]MCL7944153.1 YciI family protein [Marinobacter sp. ATCH36]
MKFMLMRKADKDTEQGVMPSEDLLQAMADYNEEMLKAGVLVSGEGLHPSKDGCRIEFTNGEPVITDGPFAETKELLAGFTVLEVASKEEAIEWATRWPKSDADGHARLELRPFFGLEEFKPGAAIDKHRQMGEQLQRLPAQINIHLAFAGNCREAMAYYADVLGGQIETMITHGETPIADQTPKDWHDKIVHASLTLKGRRIMGADMAGDCYTRPQGVQVHLEYGDTKQAEQVFNQLTEGGSIVMPFEKTFWAHRFGMVTDRFGTQWMVSNEIDSCG